MKSKVLEGDWFQYRGWQGGRVGKPGADREAGKAGESATRLLSVTVHVHQLVQLIE